ncbi:hypothetical protein D3C86_1000740 [compost metagenome]
MLVGSHFVKPSDAFIKLEPNTSNIMAKERNTYFIMMRFKLKKFLLNRFSNRLVCGPITAQGLSWQYHIRCF